MPFYDDGIIPHCHAAVSASINVQAPVTTPTVPAQLAYECITSVPLNISAALAFTKAIRSYFLRQSTTAYLKNPPAEYVEKIQNLVDVWGGSDAIEKNLTSGVWTQEYKVRKSCLIIFVGSVRTRTRCLAVVYGDFETRENTPNPTQIPKKNTDTVRTNLVARVSQIQGHEIRIVSYAHLDGGDCRFY